MRLGSRVSSQWTKLRRASVAELGVRARQWSAAWAERLRISSQLRLPNDRGFARILERFRTRTTPGFFAAFSQREDVPDLLRRRWPELEARVIEVADHMCRGQFDLLGRSRLDCGAPIDWHRDPVSGTRVERRHWSRIDHLDPKVAGEYKLIWELNRHQYFVTLGKAYWYTNDERYAATFVEHLMAWMDANPPTIGVNWASSLEVAFRAIAWIWGLHFFKASPCLSDTVLLRTLRFLYLHGRHVETYLSTYSSPNTHITGEALGLLYLGTMLPELDCAERWRRIGWTVFLEQLEKHVRPDGSYFEQSTYYHRYTSDFCLHALILGQVNGGPIPAVLSDKLRLLLDHLMHLSQPDGRTPLVGDDDGGRVLPLDERSPNDFRATLATGAALFQRSDYRYVSGPASEETLWLLGSAGLCAFDAVEPAAPAVQSRAFPDGGYHVLRDGWEREASSMTIDCGPHGVLNCGHAHADALALTLVVRGTAVLVDPGTYTYTAPPVLRDHFRSSGAHNTVTVAGQSSSIPSGPFSWQHTARTFLTSWQPGERCDYFEGTHDGYARLTPPAAHHRAVLFLKGDYWIVRDRVATEGDHDVQVHFQFAPDIRVAVQSADRVVARWGTNASELLEIGIFGQPGELRREEGWVSGSYGALSPAASCVFTARGMGTREIVSFLIPRTRTEESLVIHERAASNGRAFTIVGRGVEDTLLIGRDGEVASDDLSTDAALAWVRRLRGSEQPLEFVLVQGTRLAWRGRRLTQADDPSDLTAARVEGSELPVEVS